MKTQHTKWLTIISAAAFGLVPHSGLAQGRSTLPDREAGAARTNPSAANSPLPSQSVASAVAAVHSRNLQRAADDYEESSFRAFKGREIKSGDEKLGKVHDVIVETKTGRITHIVVSTGGLLGAGETLRLLPIERFTVEENNFSTQLDRKAYEALPKVSEKDLTTGRVGAGTSISRFGDEMLRAGDVEVGRINDIVLDVKNGLAFAVVEVEGEFAGTEGHFLVPFERLQITTADNHTIMATIERADFAHVQPEAQAAGSPAQPNPENQPLSPTGRADPRFDVPRRDNASSPEADSNTK